MTRQMKQRNFIHGLAHQALNVDEFKRSKQFYCEILGMDVLYEDAMHVFLKVGEGENFGILALLGRPKDGPAPLDPKERQGNKYNHFGFRARSEKEVFEFADFLKQHQVPILKGPYARKDGASVYFLDPDGYTLEYLYLIEDPSVYG